MKTPIKIALYVWILCVAGSVRGQAILGFTNANGFPSVITQGSHYVVSGWLKNSGNAAFSGDVDLGMTVNGTNNVSLDNNFSIASPLQPGDSIYWSRSNYTFPPGQFRMGNNDILIWSTAVVGNGVGCDTLSSVIYATEGAAFRLTNAGFEAMIDGIDPHQTYAMNCLAENVGDGSNSRDILLLARIPGQEGHEVSRVVGAIMGGQNVEFAVPSFNLRDLFQLHSDTDYSDLRNGVEFYVLENDCEMDPLNFVHLHVNLALQNVNPAVDAGLMLYPNPSHDRLELQLPADLASGTPMVRVMNMAGQTMMSMPYRDGGIDVSKLPAGSYVVEVSGKHKTVRAQLVRN